MSKKNRNLLITTAILSFVFGAFFLLCIAFMLFNIAGTKDFVVDFYVNYFGVVSDSDIKFQISMTVVDFTVGALFNIYAGLTFIKYAKSKAVLINGYKVILYVGVLQLFFFVSIIPGIMAIIVSFSIKNQEQSLYTNLAESQESENSMDELSEKITLLKKQKEDGVITDEQYNTLLNKYIEEQAKQHINDK